MSSARRLRLAPRAGRAGRRGDLTVEHATLDPFRGYANAIRDQLPDALSVLHAFHVVRLAVPPWTRCAAACNSRPWAATDTPTTPYPISRTLVAGIDYLAERQQRRRDKWLDKWLPAGDPNPGGTPGLAGLPAHPLDLPRAHRSAEPHDRGEAPRHPARLPDPRARPARPDAAPWRAESLALRHRRVSYGGTETLNLVIEKTAASRTASAPSPTTDYVILLASTARRLTGRPEPCVGPKP
jgi:hypothetical protein